ncbi:MAG: hypothetical protein WC728_08070 [Elusimicrobiota bacterium]
MPLFLSAAFAASLGFALRAAVRWTWKPDGRTWLRAGVAAGLFLVAWGATRSTPLRGGFDDEHDFGCMAVEFFRPLAQAPVDREKSPLLAFWLSDRLSGRSLDGILAAQKLLWFGSSLLVFGLLLRAGASPPASLLCAGLLLFHHLSILNTYTFSTTNANVFYLLSALCALAGLFRESGDAVADLAWFLAASFLVFTSRYEFMPVLFFGLALSAVKSSWPRRLLSERGWRMLAWISCCGAFAAGCCGWTVILLRDMRAYGLRTAGTMTLGPMEFARNIRHHLGWNNLTPILGVTPRSACWLAGAMLAVVLFVGWRRRDRGPAWPWRIFLAGWIVYVGAIYAPYALYPLHTMRLHLYFSIPFLLLAGVLADDLFAASRAWPWAAAALVLAAYLPLNARYVRSLDGELRTNDIEWQFLYRMRRSWPDGCLATYPLADTRRGFLRKYFPFVPMEDISGLGCRLIYRSPYRSVLGRGFQPAAESEDPERFYGGAFQEERFLHRFYTVWHGPGHEGHSETVEPIPVRVGFYHFLTP